MGGASKLRKYRGGDKDGLSQYGSFFISAASIRNFIDSIPKTDVYYPFLSAFYNKINNQVYGNDTFYSFSMDEAIAMNFFSQFFRILRIPQYVEGSYPPPLAFLYSFVIVYLYLYPDLQELVSGTPPYPEPSDPNYNDLMNLVNLKPQIASISAPTLTLNSYGSTFTKNPNGYYDLNGYIFALMAVTKYQTPTSLPPTPTGQPPRESPDTPSFPPREPIVPSASISEAKNKIVERNKLYCSRREIFVRTQCPMIGVACGDLSGVNDLIVRSTPNFERGANEYADQAASQYPNDIQKQIVFLDSCDLNPASFNTAMDPSLVAVVKELAGGTDTLYGVLNYAFDMMQNYVSVSDQINNLRAVESATFSNTNTNPDGTGMLPQESDMPSFPPREPIVPSASISEAKNKIVERNKLYSLRQEIFVRTQCPIIGVACGDLSDVNDLIVSRTPPFERLANLYADKAASQYPNDTQKQIAFLDSCDLNPASFNMTMDPSLVTPVKDLANSNGYNNGTNPDMLSFALYAVFQMTQDNVSVSDQINRLRNLENGNTGLSYSGITRTATSGSASSTAPLTTTTRPLTTTTRPLTTTTRPLTTTTRPLTTTTRPLTTTTRPLTTTTKRSTTTTRPLTTTTRPLTTTTKPLTTTTKPLTTTTKPLTTTTKPLTTTTRALTTTTKPTTLSASGSLSISNMWVVGNIIHISVYSDGKFPKDGTTKYYLAIPGIPDILQGGSYTTNYSPNTTGTTHIIVKSPNAAAAATAFKSKIGSYPCLNRSSGTGCSINKYYLKYSLLPFPSVGAGRGGGRTRKLRRN